MAGIMAPKKSRQSGRPSGGGGVLRVAACGSPQACPSVFNSTPHELPLGVGVKEARGGGGEGGNRGAPWCLPCHR